MAEYGLLNEVEYLLQKGADPNGRSVMGVTAFSLACANNHTQICDILLEHGAKIFDETIMDESTGYQYNAMKFFKDNNDPPRLKTYKYCIPLFSAARKGTPESIDYLISKGANIHQLDLNGETLIHKACESGNIPTLKYLIKLGVDVNASKGIVNSNKDSRGEAALHYAVRSGSLEAVRMLLENGANPNIVEYFNGEVHKWKNTPLDLLESSKESEIYKLLVAYGGLSAEKLKRSTWSE